VADAIDEEYGRLDGVVTPTPLLGDRTPTEQYDVPHLGRCCTEPARTVHIAAGLAAPKIAHGPRNASVIFVRKAAS